MDQKSKKIKPNKTQKKGAIPPMPKPQIQKPKNIKKNNFNGKKK